MDERPGCGHDVEVANQRLGYGHNMDVSQLKFVGHARDHDITIVFFLRHELC